MDSKEEQNVEQEKAAPKGYFIVLEPACSSVVQAMMEVEEAKELEVIKSKNTSEIIQVCAQFQPSILFFQVNNRVDLENSNTILRKLSKLIQNDTIKVVVTAKKISPKVEKFLYKMKVAEYTEDKITPQALLFKIKTYVKSFEAKALRDKKLQEMEDRKKHSLKIG